MKGLQYLYYFFVKIIIQNSYLSYKINFLFYNKSFFIHHNNKWSLRLKSEPIWLKEKKSWETLVKDYNLSKIFNHICKGTRRLRSLTISVKGPNEVKMANAQHDSSNQGSWAGTTQPTKWTCVPCRAQIFFRLGVAHDMSPCISHTQKSLSIFFFHMLSLLFQAH